MTNSSANVVLARFGRGPLGSTEKLLAAQKDAFQAAMNGASLAESLGFLVNLATIDANDGRRCAFYVANDAGTGITHVVGMSEAYALDVDGFKISLESLACGLAIATGTPQITPDVLEEPRWAPWVWMASDHGFRGCWSFPIETSSGKRVGSFALYHSEPRNADTGEIELAEAIASTAAIIISQHQEKAHRVYSEERYRALFDAVDDGFGIIEFIDRPTGPLSDYVHVEANPGFTRLTGIPNLLGKTVREVAPTRAEAWVTLLRNVLSTGEPQRVERFVEASGRHVEVSATRIEPVTRRQVSMLIRDIEEQHLAKETLERRVAERTTELMRTESQLRQAQKMEAVGQLTGGIAHDFNNLLAGISGAIDLLSMRVAQGRISEIDKYITAAQGAATRAAALTHRLLAFSRLQTLAPKATSANKLVDGMLDLIQRTVGPSIQIEVTQELGLWPTLIDPSQFESAVLNLCINARDAMPSGGKINIKTASRSIDAVSATHLGIPAGDHVMLCVSDTGTGMPQDVIDKVFEPFFTTKPIGQGTGLGLSMIYGFVKQSGGQVHIESEVGKGTTFCIFLPRHVGSVAVEDKKAEAKLPVHASKGEVVLIVDDEPSVRVLITDLLQGLGYQAVEAADGASGLRVLQSDVRIDLVVTDVGLPGGMNGRQMVDIARMKRPGLKSLFITGFAEDALFRNGHLEQGMSILTKPFAMDVLANTVRDMVAS